MEAGPWPTWLAGASSTVTCAKLSPLLDRNGPHLMVTMPRTTRGPSSVHVLPIEITTGPSPGPLATPPRGAALLPPGEVLAISTARVPAARSASRPVPDAAAATVAITTSVTPVDAATRTFFQAVIRSSWVEFGRAIPRFPQPLALQTRRLAARERGWPERPSAGRLSRLRSWRDEGHPTRPPGADRRRPGGDGRLLPTGAGHDGARVRRRPARPALRRAEDQPARGGQRVRAEGAGRDAGQRGRLLRRGAAPRRVAGAPGRAGRAARAGSRAA